MTRIELSGYILITPEEFGADREQVRLALGAENIEARPVWKPMHMQPVFDCRCQRSEVRGRKKTEVGDQKSEVRDQRSEIRGQRSGIRSQRSGIKSQKGKQRCAARVVGGEVAEHLFDPQITQIDADYKKKEKRYKARVVGGEVAGDLFERGLCLPSGTGMTEEDLDRVVKVIRGCRK